MLNTTEWMGVTAVFVIAGMVKGVSGMGLPTVAMGLLGFLMPPVHAAALLVLPTLLTNVAQCRGPHGAALLRRFWPLWTGLVLATVWSPLPDLDSAAGPARLLLGAVLLLYGGWGLARAVLPQPGRHERWLTPATGLLTGLLSAATGVLVMPSVPYLQALRLHREALVQALGVTFSLGTAALAVRLGAAGWRPGDVGWPLLALATTAAFAGLGLGSGLRQRLAGAHFQAALYAVFATMGGFMLLRAA